MPFWTVNQLDLHDPINAEIWAHSPTQQDQIQPYTTPWAIDDVGAQQAMRAPHRLPWVPDLVGRRAQGADAIIIVGSAYGPFITGPGRPQQITPQQYLQPTAGAFQGIFLSQVVQHRPYYTRCAKMVTPHIQSCARLILTDLCRVCFVHRKADTDRGGDSVVGLDRVRFNQYTDSPVPQSWTWRRITGTQASLVIALGTIAEHGLLRVFHRNLQQPHIVDSNDPQLVWTPPQMRDARKWSGRHAHKARRLKDRLAQAPNFSWWNIQGQLSDGTERHWRLVTVPHPTGARGNFDDYTAGVIARARTAP